MALCLQPRGDVTIAAMRPDASATWRCGSLSNDDSPVEEPPAKRPRLETMEKERALALRKKHVA